MASIDHLLPTAQTLHQFEYAYDNVHNRRMEKNTFDAAWIGTLPTAVQAFLNGRNGKGDVFAHDMAYRLVDARYDVTNPLQEVQNPGTQPFATNVVYTIDGLGNRSQTQTTPPTPPATTTYAFNVVNEYTAIGGVSRTHDANGNLTDDGTTLFAYDYRNRLVEVRNKSTQAVIATYRYDAMGRRVEKAVTAGATTRFVLDGPQVVEAFDGSNLWQARYVYEDGIDRPRSMDRADIADVNGNSNTTEIPRFHYHQQALGSVTEMTQPSGAVVEWVTYDVYGQPTIRNQQGGVVASSAIGNPYLYTGRELDPETGLFFYRARTYDPVAGRFLQRDPAGYVDGLGLYEYARSAPSSLTDPTGEESERDRYERESARVRRLESERRTLEQRIRYINAKLRHHVTPPLPPRPEPNPLFRDGSRKWPEESIPYPADDVDAEEALRALLAELEAQLDRVRERLEEARRARERARRRYLASIQIHAEDVPTSGRAGPLLRGRPWPTPPTCPYPTDYGPWPGQPRPEDRPR